MRWILVFFIFINAIASKGQWVFKKVDNGFDDPYKIAFTSNNNSGYLKMERYNGKLLLYLVSEENIFCGESVESDVSLFFKNEWKRYSTSANVSVDKDIVWLVDDIFEATDEFISHFNAASKIKIRIRSESCEPLIYEFSMLNSSKALQFMK
jgi:hypothetical protein